MNIDKYLRANIKALKPYMTARDEYTGEIGCYLDANENPFDSGYNRYPDPHQKRLKAKMAEMKGIDASKIFIGNGSDEPIDVLFRVFCDPGKDNMVTIAPSYGMYHVAADINDVKVIEVPLEPDFGLDASKILAAADANTKIVMLCSPNNPSGNLLDPEEVRKVITGFDGIVVVDQAYIDFAEDAGFLPELDRYPNLVILYTLSKAWGMAALRLGFAFAAPEIVEYMSRVKYPYNIGADTQELVYRELDRAPEVAEQVAYLVSERKRLETELPKCSVIRKIYPSDANFILVKVDDARAVYNALIAEKVIVRDRSTHTNCAGCLRITVGTREENDKLLSLLRQM